MTPVSVSGTCSLAEACSVLLEAVPGAEVGGAGPLFEVRGPAAAPGVGLEAPDSPCSGARSLFIRVVTRTAFCKGVRMHGLAHFSSDTLDTFVFLERRRGIPSTWL